jgi:amidase
VSVTPPILGVGFETEVVRGWLGVAAGVGGAGDHVAGPGPRYPLIAGPACSVRWFAAAADEAAELDGRDLEPRTRRHAALGRVTRRAVLPLHAASWRERALEFFARYQVLVTPVLATGPLPARAWSERSWAANVVASVLSTGGFTAAWNLAGLPAVAVPAGVHPRTGLPIGVQLVGGPGSEPLLLAIAATIERLRPWPLVAPA